VGHADTAGHAWLKVPGRHEAEKGGSSGLERRLGSNAAWRSPDHALCMTELASREAARRAGALAGAAGDHPTGTARRHADGLRRRRSAACMHPASPRGWGLAKRGTRARRTWRTPPAAPPETWTAPAASCPAARPGPGSAIASCRSRPACLQPRPRASGRAAVHRPGRAPSWRSPAPQRCGRPWRRRAPAPRAVTPTVQRPSSPASLTASLTTCPTAQRRRP